MQFQVPQFIEIEDKIVGPLTLKQFGYLCASLGISFLLYSTLSTWLWLSLSMVVVGTTMSFALLKINGQKFSHVVLAAISYVWQPHIYVWQPGEESLPKNKTNLGQLAGQGLDLEKIIGGLTLRHSWQKVQASNQKVEEAARQENELEEISPVKKSKVRYEVFTRYATGARQVAKRVDYR